MIDNTITISTLYGTYCVPIGEERTHIKERERRITDFYYHWQIANPNGIYNISLNEIIFVRYKSLKETKRHAAYRAASTIAVFNLTELLQKAVLIQETNADQTKESQKDFDVLYELHYENTKLMVGRLKKDVQDLPKGSKRQYCITDILQ